METNNYKINWTEDDFDTMGWHDSKIYSINFDMANHRIIFDIDYIFEWIKDADSEYYKFSVSPVTLIFNNIWGLKIDLEPYENIEITDISRDNPQRPGNYEFIKRDIEWDWVIDTICGEITFKSVGFQQIIRKQPIIIKGQNLDSTYRKETADILNIPNLTVG